MNMNNLLDIFSTRELSLLIWLGLGLTATMFSKSMRDGLGGVLKLIFGKTIGTILLMLTLYASLLLFLLYKLGFWDISLLKDTIFWFCTTALVLLFTINKAKTNNYFKDIIKENLKWVIAIEFIVNFYTFSLVKELLLVPIVIFLALLQGVSQSDKRFIQVSKFLENIFAFIGLGLIAFVVYMTFKNYQEIFIIDNLFSFLLPPLLTILLIPFLYLLAIYINYEDLFVRVNFMTNDRKKNKLLKKEILLNAKLNLSRLTTISKKLNKFDWNHSDNIRSYIQTLTQ